MNTKLVVAKEVISFVLTVRLNFQPEGGNENYLKRARESASCVFKAAG